MIEGVFLRIGKYNSQKVKRLSGNTIEEAHNLNLQFKFPDSKGYVYNTISLIHGRKLY